MHKQELLQKIREAGWKIIRQEGNHYVIERNGVRSGFAVLSNREVPEPTKNDIFKKLGITGEEKSVSKFFKKREGKLAPYGTYGYELYNARESKRMSAQEVGKAVGLSGSSIILYESNRSTPKPEIQERLATVLRWPALVVIKSATQTISDSSEPVLAHSVPVAVESGSQENREAVEQDTKRGWQARKARRENRLLNQLRMQPKKVKIPRTRRAKTVESTTPKTRQEIFDGAMLLVRIQFNELIEKANKWDAIKDLIKDEE